MKKSFIFSLITTCMLTFVVSCSSPIDELGVSKSMETAARKTTHTSNSLSLPPVDDLCDLPAYIGALHNASVYAFVDYVQVNNLSPYEIGGLTEAMIDTFAAHYVNSMLVPVLGQFELDNIEVSTGVYDALGLEYIAIINSISDVEEINNAIQEQTIYVYESLGVRTEDMPIYDAIKEIATATNVLWGCDWDFSQRCFDCPYINAANNAEEEPRTEEDQKELKKADIDGAINGAVEGAVVGIKAGIATGGGVVVTGAWGALIGAAVGAVASSVKEYVVQEMVEVSKLIQPEDVIHDTYLYEFLLQLQQTDPEKYQKLFDGKFDGYIN